MGDQWHYTRNGKQVDPVSAADLKLLAASGQISPTDMVWREGMAAWVPASSLKGLITSAVAPPPLAPPPLPYEPPPYSPGSETRACAFCRKPMSSDAIRCPSCNNWRQDIHLL